MKIGRLALRAAVGGLFVGHGTQKLFGWFDGNGLEATAQGFDAMGLRPGRTNAIIAGAGEALGGAALAAGYQTPLAAAPIVGSMAMAIRHVHGSNGPWSHKGGYEYNVVLALAALAIVESGPGPLSLDGLRHKEKQGLGWTLFTLALGVGGAAAVEQLAASKAAAQEPEAPYAPVPEPAAPAPASPAPAPTEVATEPAEPVDSESTTSDADSAEADDSADASDATDAPDSDTSEDETDK